jgi:hypothetical protein
LLQIQSLPAVPDPEETRTEPGYEAAQLLGLPPQPTETLTDVAPEGMLFEYRTLYGSPAILDHEAQPLPPALVDTHMPTNAPADVAAQVVDPLIVVAATAGAAGSTALPTTIAMVTDAMWNNLTRCTIRNS